MLNTSKIHKHPECSGVKSRFLSGKTIITFLFFVSIIACQPSAEKKTESNETAITSPMDLSKLSAEIIWANRTGHNMKFEVTDSSADMDNRNISPQYPASGELVNLIFEEVLSGKLKAYSAVDLMNLKEIPIEEINEIGHRIDTITMTDPVTLNDSTIVIEQVLDRKTIKKFSVIQDWFYNKQTKKMETKIIALCPIRERFDDQGNYLGIEPLFYVFF